LLKRTKQDRIIRLLKEIVKCAEEILTYEKNNDDKVGLFNYFFQINEKAMLAIFLLMDLGVMNCTYCDLPLAFNEKSYEGEVVCECEIWTQYFNDDLSAFDPN